MQYTKYVADDTLYLMGEFEPALADVLLTGQELELLDAVRCFDWGTNTFQLSEALGRTPEELEVELAVLVEKKCLWTMPHDDERPTAWAVQITNSTEITRLKEANNPDGKPVGHFTGRCMGCESDNLWSDDAAYGCKCCGAFYATGSIAPRMIENGTGRDLGPAW